MTEDRRTDEGRMDDGRTDGGRMDDGRTDDGMIYRLILRGACFALPKIFDLMSFLFC